MATVALESAGAEGGAVSTATPMAPTAPYRTVLLDTDVVETFTPPPTLTETRPRSDEEAVVATPTAPTQTRAPERAPMRTDARGPATITVGLVSAAAAPATMPTAPTTAVVVGPPPTMSDAAIVDPEPMATEALTSERPETAMPTSPTNALPPVADMVTAPATVIFALSATRTADALAAPAIPTTPTALETPLPVSVIALGHDIVVPRPVTLTVTFADPLEPRTAMPKTPTTAAAKTG
jgi:hypothetical protein